MGPQRAQPPATAPQHMPPMDLVLVSHNHDDDLDGASAQALAAPVNPEESVRIHQELGARRSLGIHWSTFRLTDEPLDEPPRKLAETLQAAGLTAADFSVTAIGETLRLPPRTPQAHP